MSLFDWVGDRFNDMVHGVENAADWVGDRINDVTDGIHDLFTDTPDAQAIEMAELVRKVKGGYGSGDLHGGAGIVRDQTGMQQQAADDSHALVQSLESAWQGQAADAARGSIMPLAQSADAASQTLSANGQNLTIQGEQFDRTKTSMAEMPDQPPEKSWFTHFNPITTDSERAVAQYNQLASQNREIFDGYHSSTQGVQGSTQIDYGTLPDAQNAGVGNFQLGPNQTQSHVESTHVTPQSHTSTSMPTQRHGESPSTVNGPGTTGGLTNSPGGLGSTHQSGYTAPSNSNNTSGSLSGNLWDGGSGRTNLRPDTPRGPSGFGPVGGFGPGGFGPGGSGYGGSTTGGGGSTGRFGAGSGGGSAAGEGGRTGGESGRGAMTGGRAAGAGEPGGAGRAGMAESARGATGGRGASGMGGMGGAGKGQGGEDDEHQRPSYLLEEDAESLFGSDEKTVPPVIGE